MGILLTSLLLLPQDDLDLDKLFKQAKWEEIADVLDKGYEVEKVTKVAGVRGSEATVSYTHLTLPTTPYV